MENKHRKRKQDKAGYSSCACSVCSSSGRVVPCVMLVTAKYCFGGMGSILSEKITSCVFMPQVEFNPGEVQNRKACTYIGRCGFGFFF